MRIFMLFADWAHTFSFLWIQNVDNSKSRKFFYAYANLKIFLNFVDDFCIDIVYIIFRVQQKQ